MNPQYLSTDMLICCNKYLGKFISHSVCFTIGVWEVFELFISTIAFFYLAPFPRIMASIPHLLWKGGRVFSKIPSNYFHSVLAQTKFCSIGSCFLKMYDFPAKNAVSWLLISSHSDSWPWKEKLRGLWNMFLAELQRCPFRSKILIMSENTLHRRALKAVNVLQLNQTFEKANILTS